MLLVQGQEYHPPKFDPTEVQTHDRAVHVTEMPAATTRPSVTSILCYVMYVLLQELLLLY